MEDVGRRYVHGIQSTGLTFQHGLVGVVFGRARPPGGGAYIAQALPRDRIDLGKRSDLYVRH